MSDVTNEGKRLIDAWVSATQALETAKSRVNSASCDVSNTTRALAKWLLPDDAKFGEKIAVWHGDSLIQVELVNDHREHIITVRTRGKRGLTG